MIKDVPVVSFHQYHFSPNENRVIKLYGVIQEEINRKMQNLNQTEKKTKDNRNLLERIQNTRKVKIKSIIKRFSIQSYTRIYLFFSHFSLFSIFIRINYTKQVGKLLKHSQGFIFPN